MGVVLAACGGGGSGVDAGFDAGPRPANLLSLPQVRANSGHVLTAPQLVTVTFPGDPLAKDLQTLGARLGASRYWAEVTSEYGVRPAVVAGNVVSATAAPSSIDDTAIQSFITAHQGVDWPAATTQTVYILYFPASTTVSESGLTGCVEFSGYHGFIPTQAGALLTTYAVVVRCEPDAAALPQLTSTASHELVEVTTDPALDAFHGTDAAHNTWVPAAAIGDELGDMCEYLLDQNIIPSDVGYAVQRTWSNAAAAAGREPCIPSPPDEVFAIAKMNFPDGIDWAYQGASDVAFGLAVPFGGSATLDVQVDGDKAGVPVEVSAKDLSGRGWLSFTVDQPATTTGSTVHLTVQVNASALPGPDTVIPFDTHAVVNGRIRYWFGFVKPW